MGDAEQRGSRLRAFLSLSFDVLPATANVQRVSQWAKVARLSHCVPEPVGVRLEEKVRGIFPLRRLGHLGWQDLREKVAQAAKFSEISVQILGLPLTCCAICGKILNFSEPCLPQLQSGGDNSSLRMDLRIKRNNVCELTN